MSFRGACTQVAELAVSPSLFVSFHWLCYCICHLQNLICGLYEHTVREKSNQLISQNVKPFLQIIQILFFNPKRIYKPFTVTVASKKCYCMQSNYLKGHYIMLFGFLICLFIQLNKFSKSFTNYINHSFLIKISPMPNCHHTLHMLFRKKKAQDVATPQHEDMTLF